MTEEEARKADMAIARSLRGKLCSDCPPAEYPEAPARCAPCPRRPPLMTPRQIELARHALGLRPGRLVSTRNLWWCVPPHPDLGEWEAMVATGHAVRHPLDGPFESVAAFHLTRAGAERALLPGDVLDPEDWK